MPAETLVAAVLDGSEPWWRRRTCARALEGRVPPGAALLDVVRDPEVTTEVRAAVLAVLPPSAELLTWLRAQEEYPYGLDLAIVRARARLADTTVVPQLVAMAADEWPHRRTAARQALDVLGEGPVLAALGVADAHTLMLTGDTEAIRLLGMRWAADVTEALADPSPLVAREAYEWLAETPDDHDTLLTMVEHRAPGHLWALAVLAARGEPVRPMWEALGRPVIELPTVPQDIREAIVRHHAPGTARTDPRWLLEAAFLPPARPREALPEAMAALAPLNPQPPVEAGEWHGSGEGTYHVITTDAGGIQVSTLGPYYRGDAELPGFRRIEPPLASVVFAGLPVYYFGRRAPLTVDDLLFYWQD